MHDPVTEAATHPRANATRRDDPTERCARSSPVWQRRS